MFDYIVCLASVLYVGEIVIGRQHENCFQQNARWSVERWLLLFLMMLILLLFPLYIIDLNHFICGLLHYRISFHLRFVFRISYFVCRISYIIMICLDYLRESRICIHRESSRITICGMNYNVFLTLEKKFNVFSILWYFIRSWDNS